MRTTVDINDALMRDIQDLVIAENASLKDIMNRLIAKGLGQDEERREMSPLPSWPMGTPVFDYSKAWDIVDAIETDAVADKVDLKK